MLSIFSFNLFAQTENTTEQRLNAWFTDAKLGIFIHWGVLWCEWYYRVVVDVSQTHFAYGLFKTRSKIYRFKLQS
ncbi:alpha-L-fucosidase [Capnocytophaga canimorsus]|nr:alpha-L-fucosidase [Capnocytophaga canimorsus]WGU71643.1 alpha-L-fucosidase [Capnocytophaga canimorsus]